MRAVSRDFPLFTYLQGEKARVDAALERALVELAPLLPAELRAPVEQGVMAGGKRLRPILCVTAYRTCRRPVLTAGGSTAGGAAAGGAADGGTAAGESAADHTRARNDAPPALYDLAVSLELVHAYSLMHDDLPCMDDADLRRGRPTPHTVHGEHATAVAGAALIPAAGLQLWRAARALGHSAEGARGLLRILARAAGAGGMVGGQGLDLLGEGETLTREELDGLHRRKTGALLTAALLLGGRAAGASSETVGALERYGEEIGLAFQIADDVLDEIADVDTLGKNPSDRDHGKSTYVALLGVEGARAEAQARIEGALRALRDADIVAPPLEALAGYVVARDR